MTVQLGVIADDITGACDVAAGVTEAGMPAEVRLGVPDVHDPPQAPAVVVALKSRTSPADEAVAESIASARALRAWGAEVMYQKYCSTFDSTDDGNIGPVADALLDEVGPDAVTVGTPATPAAGRTMHRGHLFVGDVLLSESSLARHPLTPMTDPDLRRVLGRQTRRPVDGIRIEDVRAGADAVRGRLERARESGVRHVLVDAVEDTDLDILAAALDGQRDIVVAGAAGLASAIARRASEGRAAELEPPPAGRGLLLSGSASERTRAQVAAFRGPVFRVDPDIAVTDSEALVAAAVAFADAADLALVSATTDPDAVREAQRRWGVARSAEALEGVLAKVAAESIARSGVRRVLVAGGETSGAVAAALDVKRLRVRRVISSGVPWMTAVDGEGRTLDLCFKSGNFGAVDLFTSAWKEPDR